jgi:predicted nucleic acid-binding protein
MAKGAKGVASRGKKTPAKPAFVLDSSITIAWHFEDESNAYADAVQDTLTARVAFVSSLWPLEVANALLVGERRKRTTEAKISQFLGLLQGLPIRMDDETALRAWHDTLHLARAHALSVYDASYLELALRRGLPLASLDDDLNDAAAAIGVATFKP